MQIDLEEELTDTEEAEIAEEVKEIKKRRRPMASGLVLSIFAAVVVIMIGGLTSYYYYTVQSQGASSEKILRSIWTASLTNAADIETEMRGINNFDDITGQPGIELATVLTTANRDARDGAITVAELTGLSVKGADTAQKMSAFLGIYAEMVAEALDLVSHPDQLTEEGSLEEIGAAAENAMRSYDELLLAGKGIVSGTFPRSVFELPEDFHRIAESKTESDKQQSEEAKAIQQAAETTVSRFVDAWRARNADNMRAQLTNGAKAEFQPGILEDTSEIESFKIVTVSISEEKTSVTVSGSLTKTTPDEVEVSETWRFGLLKQGEAWLIDSWSQS